MGRPVEGERGTVARQKFVAERQEPVLYRRSIFSQAEAYAGDQSDGTIEILGSPTRLREPLLAIFASVRVPPDLVFPALEFAERLRARGVPVIGGFHTPLERCLLDVLVRGDQGIVLCPAQCLDPGRLSAGHRKAIDQGRLTLVAPAGGANRPTADSGARRNELVVRLANRVLIVHARSGSRTFRTAALAIELGREVYAFDHARNTDLFLIGASTLARRAPVPDAWRPGDLVDRASGDLEDQRPGDLVDAR